MALTSGTGSGDAASADTAAATAGARELNWGGGGLYTRGRITSAVGDDRATARGGAVKRKHDSVMVVMVAMAVMVVVVVVA